jgi:hypothetical protein
VTEPRHVYQTRLAARRATGARLDRFDLALSTARGILAVAALVLAWLVLGRHAVTGAVLLIPGALFLAAVVLHERLTTRRTRNGRAVTLYERALARLDGNWADQRAEDGGRFLDPAHPFAGDMDLFGPHSLFQLLCTARTAGGEATLARWLLVPAAPDALRARQAALEELRGRLDLREALWVAGEDVRAAIDPEKLAAWGEAPSVLPGGWLRGGLLALSLLMAVVGTAWIAGALAAPYAEGCAALVIGVSSLLRRRAAAVTGAIGRPEAHLALLAALVRVFEDEFSSGAPFTTSLPRALHDRLSVDGKPASRQIARLGRLARLLEWEKNLVFAPVAYALLWRPQLACAIEAWRRRSGPRIAAWMQALSELEALGSLATYAHDHPERPFAELVEASAGPLFEATELAHPLLERCVPNDVSLGGAAGPRLILLSGSNMSGKSTLMRTVGVNAVLALAGAPVRGRRLRLSPLVLGATLRIQDSLLAGTSRFYAEVSRLRQLVTLAGGPAPLLFLVDEILSGTNSADRRLGAAAVLRGLVERGALGIASTHDLALTEIVTDLPGQAVNQHFEDQLEGDTLRFDYLLRPGVVQRSNALALMRAVGLEV